MHKKRPFIEIWIHKNPAVALYNSGADISCISEREFRKIPIDKRPKQEPMSATPCLSASGQQLKIKGIYQLPITIL
jgi:hypothetical protein